MREILKEYGNVCIAITVGLFLISLCMNIEINKAKGMGQVTGQLVETNSSDKMVTGVRNVSYDSIRQKELTKMYIDWKNKEILSKDIIYIDEIIKTSNKSAKITLISVTDQKGNESRIFNKDGRDYVRLEKAGVYTFYLKEWISDKIYRYGMINVPVC